MATKKSEHRRGAFLHGRISGDPADMAGPEFREVLEAASPRGRIRKWKPHAERLGVGISDLREAEGLIDSDGRVEAWDRFESLLAHAGASIEAAQTEETLVPLAKPGAVRERQIHAPRQKKCRELLDYCKALMRVKPSPSAAHLWSRVPLAGKPAVQGGARIFRVPPDEAGEEKIRVTLPNGRRRIIGERAFRDYFALVKKLEV